MENAGPVAYATADDLEELLDAIATLRGCVYGRLDDLDEKISLVQGDIRRLRTDTDYNNSDLESDVRRVETQVSDLKGEIDRLRWQATGSF